VVVFSVPLQGRLPADWACIGHGWPCFRLRTVHAHCVSCVLYPADDFAVSIRTRVTKTRAGCMPLPAATVAACFVDGLLSFGQTATRLHPSGAEVVPVCFFEVAAFTATAMPPMGEVRDYGQASES